MKTKAMTERLTHYIRYDGIGGWDIRLFVNCRSSLIPIGYVPTRAEAERVIAEWNRISRMSRARYEIWEPERTYTPVLPGFELPEKT